MAKYLMLKKNNIVRNNGTAAVVSGGVKVFLRNFYGSSNAVQQRTVDTMKGSTTVTNLTGVYKVDDTMKKQVKYFFDKDVDVDSYINVTVALWGKRGDVVANMFAPAEGDLFLFMADNVTADEFPRKNGKVGLALNVTAYDFDVLRRAKDNEDGNASKPAAQAPSYQSNPAPAPAAAQTVPDFEAIDDSDDLPF